MKIFIFSMMRTSTMNLTPSLFVPLVVISAYLMELFSVHAFIDLMNRYFV
uniref:Beta V3 protein n=1 Tax=Cotton leaf curl Multan betasatellite TaxID=306025 RepID=Q8QNS4_9VIRU|nr:beta V3 protein [Cotton leaf curl Multan betasatellite]